jgi:transposase-like protein
MSPQPLFCLNINCPSIGKVDAGNIRVHNSLENRFRCHTCGRTFSSNKGTLFHRLKIDSRIVVWVLMLLSRGCPLQAIVFAFDIDARTIANWQKKAGEHCKAVHQELVVSQPRDLGQVQADEIRAKMQRGPALWMAMAIQVSTRLWLGGKISVSRDRKLIWSLVQMIRAQALERPILLMTDGLSTYVTAWKRAFKNTLQSGKRGGPRRVPWACVVIGQVIKKYEKKRAIGVESRRLVQGTAEEFDALRLPEQVMHTAYIERLNATFRQRVCALVRRGRCLLRREAVLEQAMYLAGCVYNFCTPQKSLRQRKGKGMPWEPRTPAMATGITDEIWSLEDLLCHRPAPAPYVRPKNPNLGRPKGSKNKPKLPQEVTA